MESLVNRLIRVWSAVIQTCRYWLSYVSLNHLHFHMGIVTNVVAGITVPPLLRAAGLGRKIAIQVHRISIDFYDNFDLVDSVN